MSSAKHFLHEPLSLVHSSLYSQTLTNPSLHLDAENKIISRRPGFPAQVALVSGGGSGHEPAFAAYVGAGLLTASVAGTIFASPSSEQVRKCLMGRVGVDGGGREKGICVVIMNYTGDVLNFGMGVEKAKASGLHVEMVIVGDDAGVGRSQGGKVGRRGIAGASLVFKITGALAATGASLEDVVRVARLTAKNVVSVGASLEHVHIPGHKLPDSATDQGLAIDELEIGMGIHNEPGSERVTMKLEELVRVMLKQCLDSRDEDRAFIQVDVKADEFVLLINNLGGLSMLELGGITTIVTKQLIEDWRVKPVRTMSGTYMTSLNALGFSISLLRLADTGLGKGMGMLELLEASSEANGWTAPIRSRTWEKEYAEPALCESIQSTGIKSSNLISKSESFVKGFQAPPDFIRTAMYLSRGSVVPVKWGDGVVGSFSVRVFKLYPIVNPTQVYEVLSLALARVIAAESEITKYDTLVGDGDCGVGLKRGAEGAVDFSRSTLPGNTVVGTTMMLVFCPVPEAISPSFVRRRDGSFVFKRMARKMPSLLNKGALLSGDFRPYMSFGSGLVSSSILGMGQGHFPIHVIYAHLWVAGILKVIKAGQLSEDVIVSVSRIANAVEETMDGTSGALYAIFLNSLVHTLRSLSPSSRESITPAIFGKAMKRSIDSLSKYTPAKPGDRTLIDALHPFVESLAETGDFVLAAKAGKTGADATKGMKASLGRTVYVGGHAWQDVPDPGAFGLAVLFQGIADALT